MIRHFANVFLTIPVLSVIVNHLFFKRGLVLKKKHFAGYPLTQQLHNFLAREVDRIHTLAL